MATSKPKWSLPNVQELAVFFIKSLPTAALNLLISGHLKPGPLIVLGETDQCTATHVADAAPWVRPFVIKFDANVPSGFLVADVLLTADRLLKGRLLQDDGSAGIPSHKNHSFTFASSQRLGYPLSDVRCMISGGLRAMVWNLLLAILQ